MSATTWILCSKIVLISTGAISIAMAIKLSVPPVMAFAFSNVPAIWSVLVSWLKPPYIYFIVNGIIITIVASSRFSHKLVAENSSEYSTTTHEYSTSTHPPIYSGKTILRAAHVVASTIPVQSMQEINMVQAPPPELAYNNEGAEDEREDNIVELKPVVVNGVIEAMGSEASDLILEEEEDDLVVSNSAWSHPETDESNHLTVSNFPETVTSPHEAQLDYFPLPARKKPLLPPRFGQTKPIKVIPAGGRSVRTSKPVKHETLESTWKKIMESRERELIKKSSETFEKRGCLFYVNAAVGDGDDEDVDAADDDLHPRRVLKSASFRDRTSYDDDIADDDDDGERWGRGVGPFDWSSNMGKIKRALSPSQDELNRRVEAFIKKFNEDMRLQRQQSIDQYMEMINRGVN